jgi:hypothetical protein
MSMNLQILKKRKRKNERGHIQFISLFTLETTLRLLFFLLLYYREEAARREREQEVRRMKEEQFAKMGRERKKLQRDEEINNFRALLSERIHELDVRKISFMFSLSFTNTHTHIHIHIHHSQFKLF